MIETEYVERLTKVEERSKSNTHQIEDLKPVISEIHTMSKTMVELISEVRHTNESVTDLNNKVEKIDSKVEVMEQEPARQWSSMKRTIFNTIVGAGAGAFATGIIYTMAQYIK